VQDDIGNTVRFGWVPKGRISEMMSLSEQARRLDRALKVAENRMEAAFSTETDELHARAQYTHDALQRSSLACASRWR
jgi:hypothetical protein